MQAVEQSLRRLQIDAIDLYQSHWDDEKTPFDETLEAYARLIQQGKVKAIGASNLDAARLNRALETSRATVFRATRRCNRCTTCTTATPSKVRLQTVARARRSASSRISRSLPGSSPASTGRRTDFAKSPRGAGMKKYLNPRGRSILAALDQAARAPRDTAQVALAWLIARPSVTAPIASATSRRATDELIAATRLTLDADALKTLDRASAPFGS